MESTFLFLDHLLIASIYAIFMFAFLTERTSGSKRGYAAQILFFMSLNSFTLAFSARSADLNLIKNLCMTGTICKELAVLYIFNMVFHVCQSELLDTKRLKAIERILKIPGIFILFIYISFLIFDGNGFVSTENIVPDYSFSGYEEVLLSKPFLIFDRIFTSMALLSAILLSSSKALRKKANRLAFVLSVTCFVYLILGMISFASLTSKGFVRDSFAVEFVQSLSEFAVSLVCVIFFMMDEQELLIQALNRNFFNAFSVPIFLFDRKSTLAFYNEPAEAFIKKYHLSTEKGTLITSYFTPSPFRYIGIPQIEENEEIHYLVCETDGSTYAARRVPLINRFNLNCGSYVAIHEFENSFLVSSLEESSYTDSLTLCKTSKVFENDMTLLRNSNENIKVYKVHMENLAGINEKLGHDAGDEFLRTVVYILSNSQPGKVYRLESSTFVFVLKENQVDAASEYLQRIEKACSEFSALKGTSLTLTITDVTEELKAASS